MRGAAYIIALLGCGLVCGCDGDSSAGADANAVDSTPPPLDAIAVDAGPCGGECFLEHETACTCALGDPCGWAEDGVCRQGCADDFADGFADMADCDRDRDGLADHREHELAVRFSPALVLSSTEENSARVPHFALVPSADLQSLSIFYAIAYRHDGGDPETGLFEHQGDSEFVVVDAIATDEGWQPLRVFLSSHYLAVTDASDWFAREEIEWETADGDYHPVVWVSVSKHANYADRDSCNAGALLSDWCEDYAFPYPLELLEVEPERNLGALEHQLVDAVVETDGESEYWEFFWTDVRFCGWQVDTNLPAAREGCAPEENSYAAQLFDWMIGFE